MTEPTKGELILLRRALTGTVALLDSIPRPSGRTRDLRLLIDSCLGIVDRRLMLNLDEPETNVPVVETRPVARQRRL
ncbi:MAG: hypothetical protein NHG36_17340 [Chromatiaceae bacterium]|nr:hypothetical protein [Candidatus Thioaporhodococcus sediminis]